MQIDGEPAAPSALLASLEVGAAAQALESVDEATALEGGLGNEREALEEQAAITVIPESGADLLPEKIGPRIAPSIATF